MVVHASSARRRMVFGVRLGPFVAGALGQLAAVQRDRAAAGGQPGVAAGVAGCFQGLAECLQVGADQGGLEAVAAGGVEDPPRRGENRRGAEHLPGLAQREVALRGGAAGVGLGPQALADRFTAGAGRVDGQERVTRPVFIRNGGDYFLTDLEIYADGSIFCWEWVDPAGLKAKLASGWVATSFEAGARTSVHHLASWRFAELQSWITPERLLGEVADEIDKLNDRPDSTGRCLLALDQYLQSRSEEDRARAPRCLRGHT
jgi:hypothetical protein